MDDTGQTRNLERIEYRYGMLERGMKRSSLPKTVLSGPDIPDSIRRSIAEEKLHELDGAYGDRHAGDPMEYDHIKLFYEDDVIEITVYNRGICLFISNDERIIRIHRVLSKIYLWGKDR